MGRYLSVAALAAILVIAAVLRIYNVHNNPPGFFADEASFGYNAYTLLHQGTDEHGARFPLLFRAFGEYKLPVFTYALVPFIAVLGLTETAVRLASATFGIATVAAVYVLGKAMFKGEVGGLASAAVLAVEPWHIHYSRTGIGDIIAYPLFLTLGLTLFFLGRTPRFWLVAALALSLAFYAHRAAWIFLPLFLALIGILYWPELRRYWRVALFSGASMAILLLPLGYHLVFGPADRIQEVVAASPKERDLVGYVGSYFSYFSASFLFQNGDGGAVTRYYLPGYGQLYWFQAPLLLLGLIGTVWRPKKERLLLIAALSLYPLAGVLTETDPISSRTIQGAILFALLTGLGLVTARDLVQSLPYPMGRRLVLILAAAVILIAGLQVANYAHRYHSEYPLVASGYFGWQWGAGAIVAHLTNVQDGYDELILDADFTQPYILLRFFAKDECAKCRIGNGDNYDPTLRQLFALRPYNLKPTFQSRIAQTLHYSSNEVAFQIAEISGGTFRDQVYDGFFEQPAFPQATFNGELEITGFATIPKHSRVVLRWGVLDPPAEDYSVSVRAVDGDGAVRAQEDFLLGDWQDHAAQWLLGSERYTVHDLSLPLEAPAGHYSLVVVVYALGPPLHNAQVTGVAGSLDALAVGQLANWGSLVSRRVE